MGAVRFDGVSFAYGDGDDVLSGFDLTIEAGQSIAIVGATGSGKSTVARLLLRFYDPKHGSVTLDGVDLRSLRVDDLRRTIGIVFEDTLLFHDTVAANIVLTVPSMDLEAEFGRIRHGGGARRSCIVVEELPDGYNTLLASVATRSLVDSGNGLRLHEQLSRTRGCPFSTMQRARVDPSKEHEIRSAMSTVMDGDNAGHRSPSRDHRNG